MFYRDNLAISEHFIKFDEFTGSSDYPYTTLEFAPNPIEISCQGRHVSKYLEELFLSLP